MDPGRDATTSFSRLIVIGVVKHHLGMTSDLSGPIYIVVQHRFLAIDCECIAVGLSFSLLHDPSKLLQSNALPNIFHHLVAYVQPLLVGYAVSFFCFVPVQ